MSEPTVAFEDQTQHVREDRTYRFTVEGAEPLERYSGVRFMPSRLRVQWGRSDGSRWLWSATVVGGRLKADGTPGKSESERRFDTWTRGADIPAWVTDAVNSTRPDDTQEPA